jgi:hypothetical protein
MCPNCHRAVAYPLKQCGGGRCPFCGYKPGDEDRRARTLSVSAPDERAEHFLKLDWKEKTENAIDLKEPRREERPPNKPRKRARKARQLHYELIESSQDSRTHAVHQNGYTVCGSYTGETLAVRVAIRKGLLLESSWRSMGKGIPSCSRCQRVLGIGQR